MSAVPIGEATVAKRSDRTGGYPASNLLRKEFIQPAGAHNAPGGFSFSYKLKRGTSGAALSFVSICLNCSTNLFKPSPSQAVSQRGPQVLVESEVSAFSVPSDASFFSARRFLPGSDASVAPSLSALPELSRSHATLWYPARTYT